ncbi:tetratricopeptide repeat protein [Noviherbaspirillum sp. ST9]|uniref:tetratricopeptide repeat protein n=1 Tax=Noviherbaspirillum sp. ST9 TaxID=3401606 RepID=UPI003B588C72
MDSVLRDDHAGIGRFAAGWLYLALAALALSTFCAVLLVSARAPLPGALAASGELFSRALVLHVTFAVVVWFLSCTSAIWVMAAGGAAGTGHWTALGLSAAGLAAMVLPLFSSAAQPVLANYVPVLEHPIFLAGLVLFLAGIAFCGGATALEALRRVKDGKPWRFGAVLSMGVAAIAFAALGLSLAQMGLPSGHPAFEAIAWAPGHLLQFVHVLLMMSVWTVLGEDVLGAELAPRAWVRTLFLLAALPALAAPVIYLSHPVGSLEFHRAFTRLMAWGCWPAAAVLGVIVLRKMAGAGRQVLRSPLGPALLLSVVLFLLGCVLGALIRGESTMVPAHYHGTVGSVTLAYMALGYRLLRTYGTGNETGERRQTVMYGTGLAVLALALAWSGWIGVPRKTLHADVMMEYPAYFAAMGLAGLGGLLAIAGAVLFLVNVVRRLRGARQASARPARRDVRAAAMLLTTLLTVATGLLIAWWPNEIGTVTAPAADAVKNPVAHVKQKRQEEVAREFAEGVRLLAAKDYQAAASALHRVLELAPRMPEAHVNMGYAMIGLKNFAFARDFFEAAISLRTEQMNAYYGLAVALEGIGDMEGALGAMRTYVHRMDPNDPFARKANAAIWEWEAALAKKRSSDTPPTAAIPENGKGAIRYPIPEKKLN